MEKQTNARCANCRFWKRDTENLASSGDGVPQGWCRRRAPQVIVTKYTLEDRYAWDSKFPATYENAWCGEHEPDGS